MLAGTVYNNLIDTLQKNPTLKKYVKYVFKGLRNNFEPDIMPCIVVEPTQNNEIMLDMNQYKNIWFHLDVIGYAYCPTDSDKNIVGDKNYKGILDIEQDIKACLQSSNTLGDTVIDLQFDPSVFNYRNFPTRGVVLPVKIMYRQADSV